MSWEYKVLTLKLATKGFVSPEYDVHSFETLLNDMGRQNWELVSSQLPADGWGTKVATAVLKRQK